MKTSNELTVLAQTITYYLEYIYRLNYCSGPKTDDEINDLELNVLSYY